MIFSENRYPLSGSCSLNPVVRICGAHPSGESRRPLSPAARAARGGERPADLLQHRLELVRVDAVGVHQGADDRIGEHLLEHWFAMTPVHGNSLLVGWSVDVDDTGATRLFRGDPDGHRAVEMLH